ncbi:MAG: RIP metalloprotease RseP [Lachnospiraceae bacterium]|nr:RIP metalloprotease RseP [Lachnospiraceae bacterium]
MNKVVEILIALVMLGIVIAFHEFGHFIMAKINGVVVKEFSIGLGPRILSKEYKGTKYSLKLLPLGGSCQMLGEGEVSDEEGSFNSKSVWKRISIIFAGPFFNFILAFLLSLIILNGIGYDPCYVTSVDEEIAAQTGLTNEDLIVRYDGHKIRIGRELNLYETLDGISKDPITITYERDGKRHTVTYDPVHTARYYIGVYYNEDRSLPGSGPMTLSDVVKDGAAEKAGLKKGDKIVSIDGTQVSTVEEFVGYTKEHPFGDAPVQIGYERDGVVYSTQMTPKYAEAYSLGFTYNVNGREKVSVIQSVKYGVVEVNYWIKTVVKSLAYIFRGKASTEDIGGPVRVVSEMTNVMETSYKTDGLFYAFLNLINWTILLSANLGVMNLLPIPALDGGRLFIYLIEVVRGKKMDPEKEGLINFIGFVLLMILMVFILFNDIRNVFH